MAHKRSWLSKNLPAARAIAALASLALVVLLVSVGPLRPAFAGWFARWYADHVGPTCSSENANVSAVVPTVNAAPPPTTTWGVFRQGWHDTWRGGPHPAIEPHRDEANGAEDKPPGD